MKKRYIIAATMRQGMMIAEWLGLSRHEFKLVTAASDLWGVHDSTIYLYETAEHHGDWPAILDYLVHNVDEQYVVPITESFSTGGVEMR